MAKFLRWIGKSHAEQDPAAATCRCPVCSMPAAILDKVDFNKCCEERNGVKLPASGKLVAYHLCDECGFCFAPEIAAWSFEDFEQRIYNADYATVDPDYKLVRPRAEAEYLTRLFPMPPQSHLDYGGGDGKLCELVRAHGWPSRSYDPFVDGRVPVAKLGRHDLVTAFEVFEHVPQVDVLFDDIERLIGDDGLLLFSTLLSDGEISRGRPLDWWYASPRNGHISIFSEISLGMCMYRYGLNRTSLTSGLHLAYRQLPAWASHLISNPQ